MTIVDTYKYGSLWVDADMTLSNMVDEGLTDAQAEILSLFQESSAEFRFDTDILQGQDSLPIDCGWYGGYPGEALDDANAEAALEWADNYGSVVAYRTTVGGCLSVQLVFDLVAGTVEDAEAIIELVEGFQDYPVLDEDLWSQIQSERFIEMLDEMIVDTEKDRDIVFTEDQRLILVESAQEFYGYWEEGYFPQDKWDEIVAEALDEDRQLHQETKLW